MKLHVTKFLPYTTCLVVVLALGLLDVLGSIHTEAIVFLGFLTVLYVVKDYRYYQKRISGTILLMLSFFIYILGYQFLGISSAGYDRVAIYLCWMIISLAGIVVIKGLTSKEKMKLLYIVYILTMIGTTYVAVNGYAYVSRGEFMPTSETSTVHGTMIMLFGGICFFWLLHDNSLLNKILAFIGVGLSIFAAIFIMQRGITLVLMPIMFGGIILFNAKRKRKVYFLVSTLLVAVLFLYYSEAYLTLLDYIAFNIPSERLFKRILQIKYLLIYGADATETHGLSGRLPLLQISIKTWTSSVFSLFFGVGDHRDNYLLIGNHSEFVDSFARFGLVGAGLLWGIVYQQYKFFIVKEFKETNTVYFMQASVIFLILILRGMMGTILNFKVGIQMYIFLPLVLNLLTSMCIKKDVNIHGNELDKDTVRQSSTYKW